MKLTGNTKRHRWVAALTTTLMVITAAQALADQVVGDTNVVTAGVQHSPNSVGLAAGGTVNVTVGGQVNETGNANDDVSFPLVLGVSVSHPEGQVAILGTPSSGSGQVSGYNQNLQVTVAVTAPEAENLDCGVTNTFEGWVVFTATNNLDKFNGTNHIGKAHVQLSVEGPECDGPTNVAPDVTLGLTATDACTVEASASWVDEDGPGPYTVTFDWGEEGEDDTIVGPSPSATSPTVRSHTFGAAGEYTVTATVHDGLVSDYHDGPFTTKNTPSSILQPINSNGSSVFKLNSTVPVKITVTDCGGDAVGSLLPTVSLVKVGSVPPSTTNEASSTSAADSGIQMRWSADGQQYIYNLATKGRTEGGYDLTIEDPSFFSSVTVRIGLKK